MNPKFNKYATSLEIKGDFKNITSGTKTYSPRNKNDPKKNDPIEGKVAVNKN